MTLNFKLKLQWQNVKGWRQVQPLIIRPMRVYFVIGINIIFNVFYNVKDFIIFSVLQKHNFVYKASVILLSTASPLLASC